MIVYLVWHKLQFNEDLPVKGDHPFFTGGFAPVKACIAEPNLPDDAVRHYTPLTLLVALR